MNFGSLFTGVGGFDLGFERSGMECFWQVEQDKHCNEVLERHYPNIERFTDVRTVGKHNLKPVDLICGGFPCQDLSVAGKRAGFAGERSSLWFEFERIIDELRPKWVVVENVPGLLSSAGGDDFAVILQSLDWFGYGVAWRVLDSQYFGVAQRRRRVFIVASLGNPSAGQVLFEQESVSGDFAPGRKEGEGTATYAVRRAQTSSNGWGISRDKTHTLDETGGDAIATFTPSGFGDASEGTGTLRSNGGDLGGGSENLVTATLRGFGHGWQGQHNDTNSVIAMLSGDDKAKTLAGGSKDCHSDITSGQQDGNVIVMSSGQANAEIDCERSPALTGLHEQPILWQMNHADEVHRDCGEISPTLQKRMGTGGNQVPLVGVRRLTPTECCRLQGFPDDWNDNVSDTQRYKQMGNAVTVNVIEWIGKRIMNIDELREVE